MNFKNNNVKEIGKEFKIGERTFYPVVEISTIEMDSSFSEQISPIALLVIEPSIKYILPLTEEKVNSEEIIDLYQNRILSGNKF
jgi:hypothetical protein